MDEQPPACFLVYGNVRTWTLIVSIINIIQLSLLVKISFSQDIFLTTDTLYLWFRTAMVFKTILLLIANIVLVIGVIKRNVTLIGIWLWTYLVWLIIWTPLLITTALYGFFVDYEGEADGSEIIFIFLLLFHCFLIYFYHIVKKYHTFEKTRSRPNVTSA